jgi:hypothetical protein
MLGASVVQGMCSNGGGNVVREVVTLSFCCPRYVVKRRGSGR